MAFYKGFLLKTLTVTNYYYFIQRIYIQLHVKLKRTRVALVSSNFYIICVALPLIHSISSSKYFRVLFSGFFIRYVPLHFNNIRKVERFIKIDSCNNSPSVVLVLVESFMIFFYSTLLLFASVKCISKLCFYSSFISCEQWHCRVCMRFAQVHTHCIRL